MEYADDVVILVGGKFLSTLRELMESALGILSFRPMNCGLVTKADLPLSSEIKHLRVVPDSKLNWNRNTEEF